MAKKKASAASASAAEPKPKPKASAEKKVTKKPPSKAKSRKSDIATDSSPVPVEVTPPQLYPPLGPVPAEAASRVEETTQRIGRELWNRLDRRQPTIFERRWWLDQILEWAMHDESVKVQMFRFVDVLPMLRSSEAVTQHLQEYFDEVRSHLPLAVRMGLEVAEPDSLLGKALAVNARINTRKMAERFIAGTKSEEILTTLTKLRKKGLGFTLDLLGEAVISEPEADLYQQTYINLIESLAEPVNSWPGDALLDYDVRGEIPRAQISLKLSALCSRFKPIDPEGSSRAVKERLRPILRAARQHQVSVHIDMEHFALKSLTRQIFQEVFLEDEFRDWADVGIVVQAYLVDAEDDLRQLRHWVEERGTSICVRLVKGAYWDFETMHAEYNGWPCPVYREKWQSDANFEQQTRFLMEHRAWLRPAIASHNLRSLTNAIAWAEELNVPRNAWEIQMLFGMAEEQQHLFSERGHRVRVYVPFGELLPGMSYLVRRLLENTSNDSFLRHAYERTADIDDLLSVPAAAR